MNSRQLKVVEASRKYWPAMHAISPDFDEARIREESHWLRENEGQWLLLFEGEELVGWGAIVWSGNDNHPDDPAIQNLWVRADRRGEGFGTYLLRAFERRARRRGFRRIGLAVNPEFNPAARRLYERLGYRHDGRAEYVDHVEGDFEDWVIDMLKGI